MPSRCSVEETFVKGLLRGIQEKENTVSMKNTMLPIGGSLTACRLESKAGTTLPEWREGEGATQLFLKQR